MHPPPPPPILSILVGIGMLSGYSFGAVVRVLVFRGQSDLDEGQDNRCGLPRRSGADASAGSPVAAFLHELYPKNQQQSLKKEQSLGYLGVFERSNGQISALCRVCGRDDPSVFHFRQAWTKGIKTHTPNPLKQSVKRSRAFLGLWV